LVIEVDDGLCLSLDEIVATLEMKIDSDSFTFKEDKENLARDWTIEIDDKEDLDKEIPSDDDEEEKSNGKDDDELKGLSKKEREIMRSIK